MTKNAVAKSWDWSADATGTGGTYNSNQPLGGDKVISIDGTNFGLAPTVIAYAKWTEGAEGEQVPLSSTDVGADFDQGHYGGGLLPNYFTLDGSTGASNRQGGVTTETNVMTGFMKVLPNFDEYLVAYDSGVPDGRHFSSESTPNTLPVISVLKMHWMSDEPLDNPVLADMVAMSWVGNSFAVGGNNASIAVYSSAEFAFNKWNGYLSYIGVGADPFVDNGVVELQQTIPDVGTITTIKTDAPTFGGGATNPYYNHVNFPAWSGNGDQSLTQHLFRYYYLAVGANARARLELGDNSVYANCFYRRVIPHTSWSATNVTVTTDSKQREKMTHWFITNADGTRQSGAL
jgi:hypothetical protein